MLDRAGSVRDSALRGLAATAVPLVLEPGPFSPLAKAASIPLVSSESGPEITPAVELARALGEVAARSVYQHVVVFPDLAVGMDGPVEALADLTLSNCLAGMSEHTAIGSCSCQAGVIVQAT